MAHRTNKEIREYFRHKKQYLLNGMSSVAIRNIKGKTTGWIYHTTEFGGRFCCEGEDSTFNLKRFGFTLMMEAVNDPKKGKMSRRQNVILARSYRLHGDARLLIEWNKRNV